MKEPVTDAERSLLEGLKVGRIDCFDRLFENHSAALYRFAYSFLRSKEESEEIVQEVFIKIWERHADINPALSFGSFLFTIAYRSILNVIRKKKNGLRAVRIHQQRQPRFHQHVEEDFFAEEAQRIAQAAIESLPAQRKKIFIMSRQQHLSGDEIARQLQLSPKTVEAQISMAIKYMRRYFTRLGIS